MNAHCHHAPAGAHDLPLLRRRLRRAGAAGRARRRRDRGRSRRIRRISAALCSKGSALGETLGARRPAAASACCGSADGTLARVDWDAALDAVADGFSRIIERDGPDAVAFYLSGQLLTEDYYVANKLMKGFIGSANVDTNSRLCMASSVAGHRRAFGADTVPGTYDDLDEADLIVLVGSNAAWCHPVLFQRMVRNKRRARRQDRRDRSAPHRDGRGGRPVPADRARHGHGAVLRPAGRISPNAARSTSAYIERAHDRLCRARSRARARSRPMSRRPRSATGLDAGRRRSASSICSRTTRRVVTCFSQGVNQSAQGTDKVNAIINCHLATGRIGRPGMGPFSLTGQPNAMGGREVGGLANQLAAHMGFTPAEIDRVRPVLERAAHGRARRPEGGADVRRDRARRDQGAVGDGDQSGGVAAARRRRARGARASSICSSSPRTCSPTTP